MAIRAVLDTNVIVSGMLTRSGTPSKIIDAWREERFEIVTSLEILREVTRVLYYQHIAKNLEAKEIEGILQLLQRYSMVVKGELNLEVVGKDPSDNKFLSCALEGEADFIVSGDSHLKELKSYSGIRIVSPKEFRVILDIVDLN